MSDELLHGAEAIAAHLGVRRPQIYYLTRTGRLPHWKEGDCILSTKALINEWLEGRKRQARADYLEPRELAVA